jgi:hypothetical protein
VAIGALAGNDLTNGNSNIDISNRGVAAESNTIRIGTQGTAFGQQTAVYIAGITGSPVTGSDVVISSAGQVGVLASSARYKRDIHPLDSRSSRRLWQLRPVTFRYKHDAQGVRQYGLIAEEVAKVYPELIVRGDKGEIESVQYRELIPLMLSEMQHQQVALMELKNQNEFLRAALARQNAVFLAHLERLERTARVKTVASR